MIFHFAVLISHFSMLSRYNMTLRGMRFSSAQWYAVAGKATLARSRLWTDLRAMQFCNNSTHLTENRRKTSGEVCQLRKLFRVTFRIAPTEKGLRVFLARIFHTVRREGKYSPNPSRFLRAADRSKNSGQIFEGSRCPFQLSPFDTQMGAYALGE